MGAALLTTAEVKSKLISKLTQFDVSKLSSGDRRRFRAEMRSFLTILRMRTQQARRPAAAAVTPDDDPAQDEQDEEDAEADGDPA